MNSTEEPATSRQLDYLKAHGYEVDHPLSKTEALEMIRRCGGHHCPAPGKAGEARGSIAFELRQACVNASATEREAAERARQEFWMDTCREPTTFRIGSAAIRELYQTRGCLFCPPSHLQTQEVLDALDAALPTWDQDHPELFYETMRLNFPELLRPH